jgi:hypothetical protein
MTKAALLQAVELVIGQAEKVLAYVRRGGAALAPPEDLTSPVLNGRLTGVTPDRDRADARADALEQLVRGLRSCVASDRRDEDLAQLIDAARAVLEEVYGRTITFAWEGELPASGARIEGRAHADVVHGKLIGVAVGKLTEGDVRGEAQARESGAGGETIGVSIERLGR